VVTALAFGLAIAGPTVAFSATVGATDAPTTETTVAPDAATTDTTVDATSGANDELLIAGSEVYQSVCSGCHQPGGAGLAGQYPPLKDNPHVQDAEYVAGVIANGRSGQIQVLGNTYDGVMPAFSTLPDADVQAVIAYIQSGFVTPATAANPAPTDTGPVAGTQLPDLANMAMYLAFAIAVAGGAVALAPRIVDAHDRLDFPWLDAWLRTAIIVVAVIVFVVYIPSTVLKSETVAKLGTFGQDVIGVGLWGFGLALVLGALWFADREKRV
jgi:mono/diheme cytochrome c family protein